jgi:hypothetical protein
MIPLPKPRGFWDYALFSLIMTTILMFLFWLEASDAVGWTDGAVASAVAILSVFAIIGARRGENAKWVAEPTWQAYVLAAFGAFVLIFGAVYADAYFLHSRDLTFSRFRHDMVLAVVLLAVFLWSWRRRFRVKRSES